MTTIPFTTTVTSHGLLITANGDAVGAITNFSPKQTRQGTPVFELGQLTGGVNDVGPQYDSGEPYEIVPGNIGGTTIAIRRYDLYTKRFETAFGTPSLEMLTKQIVPIHLMEFWTSPDGTLNFSRIYYGCWFTELGREYGATGERHVMASASVMYTRSREA